MEHKTAEILLVEDDPADVELIRETMADAKVDPVNKRRDKIPPNQIQAQINPKAGNHSHTNDFSDRLSS